MSLDICRHTSRTRSSRRHSNCPSLASRRTPAPRSTHSSVSSQRCVCVRACVCVFLVGLVQFASSVVWSAPPAHQPTNIALLHSCVAHRAFRRTLTHNICLLVQCARGAHESINLTSILASTCVITDLTVTNRRKSILLSVRARAIAGYDYRGECERVGTCDHNGQGGVGQVRAGHQQPGERWMRQCRASGLSLSVHIVERCDDEAGGWRAFCAFVSLPRNK